MTPIEANIINKAELLCGSRQTDFVAFVKPILEGLSEENKYKAFLYLAKPVVKRYIENYMYQEDVKLSEEQIQHITERYLGDILHPVLDPERLRNCIYEEL